MQRYYPFSRRYTAQRPERRVDEGQLLDTAHKVIRNILIAQEKWKEKGEA